jgi:hypothetical protein
MSREERFGIVEKIVRLEKALFDIFTACFWEYLLQGQPSGGHPNR